MENTPVQDYFTKEKWDEFPQYEKDRLATKLSNYLEMKQQGFDIPVPDFVKAWQARAKPQAAQTEKDLEEKGKSTPSGTKPKKAGRKRKPQADVGKGKGGKKSMLKEREQALVQCIAVVEDRARAVTRLQLVQQAVTEGKGFRGFAPVDAARSRAVATRLLEMFTELEVQLIAANAAVEKAEEDLRREEVRLGLRREDAQEALPREKAQEALDREDSVGEEQAKATASGKKRKDVEALPRKEEQKSLHREDSVGEEQAMATASGKKRKDVEALPRKEEQKSLHREDSVGEEQAKATASGERRKDVEALPRKEEQKSLHREDSVGEEQAKATASGERRKDVKALPRKEEQKSLHRENSVGEEQAKATASGERRKDIEALPRKEEQKSLHRENSVGEEQAKATASGKRRKDVEALPREEEQKSLHLENSVGEEQAKATASGKRRKDVEALPCEEEQKSLHREDSVDEAQAKATASGERREDVEAAEKKSVPRYSCRQRPQVNYVEPEQADEDEFLFCDHCESEHQGVCPTHGKLQFVADRQLPKGYRKADRAERTMPQVLALGESSIKGAGLGVWARQPLPMGTVFGPYEGVRSRARLSSGKKASGYGWIIKRASKVVAELDAKDSARSNWMRYVNCAAYKTQLNAKPFQFQGRLYYRTVREVPAHTELMVYYGDIYARQLGIDTSAFHRGSVSSDPPAVFVCSNCPLGFTSPIRRDRHERVSCRHRRFEDDVKTALPYFEPLPTKVPAAFELSETLNGPGPEGRKRLKCGECPYSTDIRGSLKQHMLTHTLERAFACPQCPYKATQKGNLERHLKTHSGEKPHACTECDYRAAKKSHLTNHMRTHSGEKPYQCERCDAAFSVKSNLVSHERAKHTKERPFGCTQCEYTCVQSGHLTRHMLTHNVEKKLSCTLCSYQCNQAQRLKNHMSSRHNVEKKLSCTLCSYQCNRAGRLTDHISSRHNVEKKLSCTLCSYQCNRAGRLTDHISRRHNVEKKLACSMCDYKSNWPGEMKKHVAAKHAD